MENPVSCGKLSSCIKSASGETLFEWPTGNFTDLPSSLFVDTVYLPYDSQVTLVVTDTGGDGFCEFRHTSSKSSTKSSIHASLIFVALSLSLETTLGCLYGDGIIKVFAGEGSDDVSALLAFESAEFGSELEIVSPHTFIWSKYFGL